MGREREVVAVTGSGGLSYTLLMGSHYCPCPSYQVGGLHLQALDGHGHGQHHLPHQAPHQPWHQWDPGLQAGED